jgi:dual specificity MAP kinase phosphatase
MATVLSLPPLPPSPRPVHPINPPTPPASSTPIFKFTANISTRPTTPSSIHSAPDTPPASPSDDTSSIESTESSLTVPSESSIPFVLYPPDKHEIIRREKGTLYSISAAVLAEAYQQVQTQPLPPASEVFPWLHGLNPRNAGQLCFFNAQSSSARVPPINIGYRGLTVVHVPAPFGCYRAGRLVGAVNHTEILGRTQRDGHFVDPDPPKGICLRNFHIQTPKMALLSDIVVYSPRGGQSKEVLDVAEKIAQAQRLVRMKYSTNAIGTSVYNTFVVKGTNSI